MEAMTVPCVNTQDNRITRALARNTHAGAVALFTCVRLGQVTYSCPMTETARKIDFVPASELLTKQALRNPKDHDIGALTESIKRHGFVEPIIIDKRTGRMVAGHGRLEALVAMAKSGEAPPDGVQVIEGEWRVPVVAGWSSKSDAQAEAYIIASNRITELGGWDQAMLEEMLKELARDGALFGSGYDGDDVDKILSSTVEPPPEALPQKPWVKPGQIFKLGDHVVGCGDSTSSAFVKEVYAGEMDLMVTDPPYGVSYRPEWRKEVFGGSSALRTGQVKNDTSARWAAAYANFNGDVAYVWHNGLLAHEFYEDLVSCGFEIRSQIIWSKGRFALSRGHYHWQHEPCWYAVRKGATGNWHGDRSQTTVWDVSPGAEDRDDDGNHGTPKPVELYRRALINSSSRGDVVFEPFLGSGTALIACEELGRKCVAIELDEGYVQAAISRWEKYSGKKHEVVK